MPSTISSASVGDVKRRTTGALAGALAAGNGREGVATSSIASSGLSHTSGPSTSPTTSPTTTAANGCVRWCMNVALQSFAGEPWAVALHQAEEPPFDSKQHSTHREGGSAKKHGASAEGLSDQQQRRLSQGPSKKDSGTGFPQRTNHLQLVPIDYSKEEEIMTHPLDGTFSYDPNQEEVVMLRRCTQLVNESAMSCTNEDLLSRITNVEFVSAGAGPSSVDGQIHYLLHTPLEGMLHSTLNPAITAVVDRCINAVVLVYGATQEMKQMGLIGTPEECGLLPHGIRMFMERYVARKERQQQAAAQQPLRSSLGGSSSGSSTPSCSPSLTSVPQLDSATDEITAQGLQPEEAGGSTSSRVPSTASQFLSVGSTSHQFCRVEATFVAFDSTSVVDLLDLNNKYVELALQLGPPPTPSAFEENTDESHRYNSTGSNTTTTDAFVLNACAIPAEGTNEALSALDVGLENLSHALEMTLLPSESGSSLLFSLTAYTNTCRCATFHVLCLAEDPAAQTWLSSTALARSQAIPVGEEQSWGSIQNTPMPPPLHHHAATMLVPALCFGNVFTSVLICVYNSITALARLNRDLTFAVTGHRMRTIPRVTTVSSRRSSRKLPPGWEEHFTDDGKRYYIDTSTHATTWEDPRIRLPSRSQGTASARSSTTSAPGAVATQRPSRVSLGDGDIDFLAPRQDRGKSPMRSLVSSAPITPRPLDGVPDIGIVVVDAKLNPRVVLHSKSHDFAAQIAEEQGRLRVVQQQRQQQEALELAVALKQQKQQYEKQQQQKERQTQQPPTATSCSCDGDVAGSTMGVTATPTAASSGTVAGSVKDGADGAQAAGIQSRLLQLSDDEGDDEDDGGMALMSRCASSTMEDFDSVCEEAELANIDMIINTTRFYANAMQEQVAYPAAEPCSTSVVGRTAGAGDGSVPQASVSTVTIPCETQDLESLVEEFTTFFRHAYHNANRVKALEAEVAALRRVRRPASGQAEVPPPVSASPSPLEGISSATSSPAVATSLSVPEVLRDMTDTMEIFGSSFTKRHMRGVVARHQARAAATGCDATAGAGARVGEAAVAALSSLWRELVTASRDREAQLSAAQMERIEVLKAAHQRLSGAVMQQLTPDSGVVAVNVEKLLRKQEALFEDAMAGMSDDADMK